MDARPGGMLDEQALEERLIAEFTNKLGEIVIGVQLVKVEDFYPT